jgi:hypothetical protein
MNTDTKKLIYIASAILSILLISLNFLGQAWGLLLLPLVGTVSYYTYTFNVDKVRELKGANKDYEEELKQQAMLSKL